MTPDAYATELAERASDRIRQEAEARKAAREDFLRERIAEMPKRDRPTPEEQADLLRRLLEAQDKAAQAGIQTGTVALSVSTVDGRPAKDSWTDEVDRLSSGRSVRAKMVRAEIEAACAKASRDGEAPANLRDLAQIPSSALPPGLFARIVLALAWPEVRDAWQRARAERVLRRGPLTTELMRTIGRKVPLEKSGAFDARLMDDDQAGEPRRIRVECAAGKIDLFHPAVVEQAGKEGAAGAFRAMATVLGPRALRTLWTCLDAVQRHEPDVLRSGGDFLYTPGAFADVQRPRREKVGRHDKEVIAALDEDMRRLAQTSVDWTFKAGNKPVTMKAHLVVFQNATLTQGTKAATLPTDQFGPTREKRTRGRRPAELWRINPTLLKLMQTAGEWFVWDPAVLRTSPEANTLYLDLVATARMKPHEPVRVRLIDSMIQATGVVRYNPHAPERLRERLEALLEELRDAGVLFGRIEGERLLYTLPERHAAALASIPKKRHPPTKKHQTKKHPASRRRPPATD